MKNVFIDLGAGSGDDIKGYYKLAPDNKTHEVHAFEPNPKRTDGIKARFPNINVYTAAAGIKEGTVKLYLGNSLNTSSTNENKVSINTSRYIESPVIDIPTWLKQNFRQTDYITMVMDIEGGEYELLQAMYDDGVWSWIDEMYVEFHGTKLRGFDMKIEEDLTKKLIDYYEDKVYIFRKHNHEQFVKLNAEGA
ncbi:hypothetical protein CMO86_08205 [Candidatus Woesearchaeota archaeon]|jgi:FkbM family methyltransferase|nr:hypothetical protein [Candidatus Woesearchaeota archaeon]|tara:strand:- start:78 stop:656 length:579 start_codon:yes stop_codon:yes gene_type:complete